MTDTYISPQTLKDTLNDIGNFVRSAQYDWEDMPDWVENFLSEMDELKGQPTFRKNIWATLHRAYRHAGSGLLERVQEIRKDRQTDQPLNFLAAVAQDIYGATQNILRISKTEVKTCRTKNLANELAAGTYVSQTHNLVEELVAGTPMDAWPERIEETFNNVVRHYPEFTRRTAGLQDALLEQLREVNVSACGTPHILEPDLEELLNHFIFQHHIEECFNGVIHAYPEFSDRIGGLHEALLERLKEIPIRSHSSPETMTARIEEELNRFMFEQNADIREKTEDLEKKLYTAANAPLFDEMAESMAPDLPARERDETIQLARQIAGYSFIGKYGLESLPNPSLKEALKYRSGSLDVYRGGIPGIITIGSQAGTDFEDICATLGTSLYNIEYGLSREGVAKATVHMFEQLHTAELMERLRKGGNVNEYLPQIEKILSFLNEVAPEHDSPKAQDLALIMTALASYLDTPAKDAINTMALRIAEAPDDSTLQAILADPGYIGAHSQLDSVFSEIPAALAEPAEQARKILADSVDDPSSILVEPRMTAIHASRGSNHAAE